MNRHREDFCKHPGIDFTRDRKIPFDTPLHFQISMESGSVNHELLKYFYFDTATPSLSALYELIDRHTPGSGTIPVFIADRGFHAYNAFAHAIENNAFLLSGQPTRK